MPLTLNPGRSRADGASDTPPEVAGAAKEPVIPTRAEDTFDAGAGATQDAASHSKTLAGPGEHPVSAGKAAVRSTQPPDQDFTASARLHRGASDSEDDSDSGLPDATAVARFRLDAEELSWLALSTDDDDDTSISGSSPAPLIADPSAPFDIVALLAALRSVHNHRLDAQEAAGHSLLSATQGAREPPQVTADGAERLLEGLPHLTLNPDATYTLDPLGAGAQGLVAAVRDSDGGIVGVVKFAERSEVLEREAAVYRSVRDAKDGFCRAGRVQGMVGLRHGEPTPVHWLPLSHASGAPVTRLARPSAENPKGGTPRRCAAASALAQSLVPAVTALHAGGHVSLDIKPENLLLSVDDSLRVLDFGLARPLGAPIGDVAGTLGFSWPNVRPPADGNGGCHPDHDWYSVGMVLYAVATGRMPPCGEEALATLRKAEHWLGAAEQAPDDPQHPDHDLATQAPALFGLIRDLVAPAAADAESSGQMIVQRARALGDAAHALGGAPGADDATGPVGVRGRHR